MCRVLGTGPGGAVLALPVVYTVFLVQCTQCSVCSVQCDESYSEYVSWPAGCVRANRRAAFLCGKSLLLSVPYLISALHFIVWYSTALCTVYSIVSVVNANCSGRCAV